MSKPKIPSIDALQREKTVKDESKVEIFTVVLNKCIEKILYSNRHTDKTYVIFEVPKILIGYPSYDMKSCILFLITQLSQHGYLVEFIEPFYLYIDWGSGQSQQASSSKGKVKTRLKHSTQKLLERFPDTSQIEFVYEDSPGFERKRRAKRK
jgi:Family of unknown function (DUF5759)